jgi:hypothetical protein
VVVADLAGGPPIGTAVEVLTARKADFTVVHIGVFALLSKASTTTRVKEIQIEPWPARRRIQPDALQASPCWDCGDLWP